MKPIFQSLICNKMGDCFSACIASILEIPLEDVPKLDKNGAWMEMEDKGVINGVFCGGQEVTITKWLAEKGFVILQLWKSDFKCPPNNTDFNYFDWGRFSILEPYVICTVPSQRFEGCSHAVVGQFKVNKEEGSVQLIQSHDPNINNAPYENFYEKVSMISILVKVK